MRQCVGLIHQKPALFPCSIHDNVIFGLRGKQRKNRSAGLIEQCLRQAALWDEVHNRLHAPANILSIGQQQRLCLARALALSPSVLLLDEPTASLDPRSKQLIEASLLKLAENMPILCVTHDIEQARRLDGTWIQRCSVILAVIILPLLVLNSVHAIERVAVEKTDAACSLGLPEAQIIWRVWLPEAWPAMLTGLLLGMARALSETAPILFTATVFSGIVWPDSIFSPVTSLQTHIFYLAQEGANPQAQDVAWASAMILVVLVTLFGMGASMLRLRKTGEEN